MPNRAEQRRAVLITQMSQVQILPPLPRSAGQMPDRQDGGRAFWLVGCFLLVRWRDGTPERGTLRGRLAWIGIAVGWRDRRPS